MVFLKEYEAWYSYYKDATAGQEVCRCVAPSGDSTTQHHDSVYCIKNMQLNKGVTT